MSETCDCKGDRRKDGFASEVRDGVLWWVCAAANCRRPTAAWLAAMRKLRPEAYGEAP